MTTLRRIAHVRSGDKGNAASLSVIAYAPEFYPLLIEQVTAARVAERLGAAATGPVTCYRVDAIEALNFRIDGVLGGGVSRNRLLDVYGKSLCTAMLDLPVFVPTALTPLLAGPGDAPALLAGSWELVAYRRRQHGETLFPFGPDARGWISYTGEGRMSATLCERARPPMRKPVDARWNGDRDELAAAAASYLAYTGTYVVHEDRVEHLVEACSYPNWIGTTLTRWFDWVEQDGDMLLRLVTAPPERDDARELVSELLWRRWQQPGGGA
ncbi:lipocalin-like domain-containing protein [Sphingomonas sp.]|uniref:lipocalin-like domain-containing protein n=1 Tax=Sphingomonas sp. TaxID=28214 RepID=UPI001ECD8C81|nr:lipocalin-like domain-containing protein [Sphingomonas sp.]MBX3594701.1 lipocalin-like domain-containing protein [Sphingomonas sp.]